MSDLLDIVNIVILSLPSFSWFVYLIGAVLLSAAVGLTYRFLYWR